MTFEEIRVLNPNVKFYKVTDTQFRKYGRVLDLD